MIKFDNKRGASLLSYGLVVGLISVVALSAVTEIGSQGSSLFTTVGDSLNDVTSGQAGSGSGAVPSGPSCTPGSEVFGSPGGPFSFDLASDGDADCGTIEVLAWAGGGGGADGTGTSAASEGGAGGFVSAVLAPGVVDGGLQIHVGAGGEPIEHSFFVPFHSTTFVASSGSGGGGSAVLDSTNAEIIVAGAGGGASNLRGGNGGGNSSGTGGIAAEDAPDCDSGNAEGGHGGTASAPGAGGSGTRRNGQPGVGNDGGDGTSAIGVYDGTPTVGYGTGGAGYGFQERDDALGSDGDNGGGGGGGGWFGGGGGGGSPAGCGGGGGSSYRDATLTASGTSLRGAETTAPATSEAGYLTGTAEGGVGGTTATAGGDGLVIIRWSE